MKQASDHRKGERENSPQGSELCEGDSGSGDVYRAWCPRPSEIDIPDDPSPALVSDAEACC